ncbi:MAG TPA: lipocalin family protein, partial [Bacteroidia bacterium]|nr:lipocalin family protein [Bacteroidia bacterium]
MTTATAKNRILQTVQHVDLEKYCGKWYEIASYPQTFEKNCYCSTAEYTLSDKGYVVVENSCNLYGVNGKKSRIRGKAFVVKD